jgi:predicted nucleic acid-binding protein
LIFLDTSAIYAAADDDDARHEAAFTALERLLQDGEELLVHNYVILEVSALLQRRLGLPHALTALKQSQDYLLHWITSEDHEAAVALLEERGRRGLSFVDCASFIVMRRYGVTTALVFDSDFEAEGFEVYRRDANA